jgi:hypothetical protein
MFPYALSPCHERAKWNTIRVTKGASAKLPHYIGLALTYIMENQMSLAHHIIKQWECSYTNKDGKSLSEKCRNPSLGLATKTRVARLQTKWGTWESHHMLPGMQRVWGNPPSHSQMNSHGGNWNPKWTPETSKSDFRGPKLNGLWRSLYHWKYLRT